ncbi:MAG TPA: hypothetical protein VGE07_04300 [Herpetosiphonaceae bacterium]
MAVISRPVPTRDARAAARVAASPAERAAGLLGILSVVAALMSILYLAQTGRVATQGYRLEQLEVRRSELVRRNQQLRFEIEIAQSLDTVRTRADGLGLKPVRPAQERVVTIEVAPEKWAAAAR